MSNVICHFLFFAFVFFRFRSLCHYTYLHSDLRRKKNSSAPSALLMCLIHMTVQTMKWRHRPRKFERNEEKRWWTLDMRLSYYFVIGCMNSMRASERVRVGIHTWLRYISIRMILETKILHLRDERSTVAKRKRTNNRHWNDVQTNNPLILFPIRFNFPYANRYVKRYFINFYVLYILMFEIKCDFFPHECVWRDLLSTKRTNRARCQLWYELY